MRITTGSDASHPLLVRLVEQLSNQGEGPWDVTGLLAEFWQDVAEVGTPLLQSLPDGQTRITYLWREGADADYDGVSVEGWPQLAVLAGTDVWFGEADVPDDYVDAYCFNLSVDGKTVNEDVHEPWATSYADKLNPVAVTEQDAYYPRNIVAARGVLPRGELAGSTRILRVPSTQLELPERTAEHPAFFPVWVYEPPRSATATETPLPVVVLINGQFLESSDALAILDDAMASGELAPALVVTACSRPRPSGWAAGRAVYEPGDYEFDGVEWREHTAWGWRNGYGPRDLSDFLLTELLPALRGHFAVRPGVHLVSWDTGAEPALATAAGAHEQVDSVTLLLPSGLYGDDQPHLERTFPSDASVQALNDVLSTRAARVAISEPTPRSGRYSWVDEGADALVAAIDSSLAEGIARVPLTDPNIAAGAYALVPAIQWALQRG